jgi:uncharacterized protein (TIGR03067 family)
MSRLWEQNSPPDQYEGCRGASLAPLSPARYDSTTPRKETPMRRVLPLLSILCLAFAPVPFPKPDRRTPKDLAAMRGEWEVISCHINGGLASTDGHTAVFDGNRLHRLTEGRTTIKWIVTLDSSKKPKWMDLKDANVPGRTLLCIYKLEGDTLTCAFCNEVNAQERPTDFNPDLMGLEVFKRKKR